QWITDENKAMEREQQVAINLFINNNRLIHQLNQENNYVSHCGSIVGHVVILRDRQTAHCNLYNDYFAGNHVYSEREFHRQFRMSQKLFLHIVDDVKQYDNYFIQ